MKRHPYPIAFVIAMLLAVVVWLCVPETYTATTRLSDEYKEMDIAIGMDRMKAKIREVAGSDETGINDMGVYSRVLKSEDFARLISQKKVPERNIDYGTYLGKSDTIEAIQDNINYNYNSKQSTLIIGFTDSDPAIAASMLDSVTTQLQNFITSRRQGYTKALLSNASRNYREAREKYDAARKEYAQYIDTHVNTKIEREEQEANRLSEEVKLASDRLKECVEQYVRAESLSNRAYYSFTVIQPSSVPLESDKHLYNYLFGAVIIFILLMLVQLLYKKSKQPGGISVDFGGLSSPWAITLIIWGSILIALQLRDPELLEAPDEQFYISLVIWLLLFCFVAFVTFTLSRKIEGAASNSGSGIEITDLNRYAYYLLLLLSIVMTPLYVKKVYDIVLMFGTEDFMHNVRSFAVYGDANMGFLEYSITINISLLLVSLYGYPKIKKWQIGWACAACMLNALAIMEKGGFLTVFFCLMFVLYERKVIKLRSVGLFSVVVLLFFFMFNIMREETDSDYSKNESLLGFIAMYILSPPVAYCHLSEDVIYQFSARTTPMLYYLLNKYWADIFMVYDRLQPFVFIPIPTNVYTIFQPFYQDFGYRGVAAWSVIYGLICGFLYAKKCDGNSFANCLYLYFAYILALQFFQENLFTVGLYVPRIMFFTYLCTQKTFTISRRNT